MGYFIAIGITAVVTFGLTYGFRGWIARKRAAAIGALKQDIEKL